MSGMFFFFFFFFFLGGGGGGGAFLGKLRHFTACSVTLISLSVCDLLTTKHEDGLARVTFSRLRPAFY